jgi:hypothetical protein
MASLQSWQSNTALLVAMSLTAGVAAPLVVQTPVQAQTTFSDVQSNYWAESFIQELSDRGVIRGFPDGTFRPNDPVTRAQFAAMVRQAFSKSPTRNAVSFVDVPNDYWAYSAIQEAYTTGFLSGYPGNIFSPGQNIPRAQVLVSLTSGLQYNVSGTTDAVLAAYRDADSIPGYARGGVAAATQKELVVNYPNVEVLNPTREATRAEVAALIYQALVSSSSVSAISSPYIVGQAPTPTPQQAQLPAGTTLAVRYDQAEKILVSPDEPNPVPVTLKIDRDIVSQSGAVLIPANSQVIGELRIFEGGTQFYANQLVMENGTSYNINATSQMLTNTEVIRRGANLGEVLGGAALGAAAATGVSAVTGDRAIATEEVLGGTAAGALLSFFLGRDRVTLYSVNPNTDLNLTLNTPLILR